MKTIPNNALVVTADVVGLYLSLPHESRLKAIKEALIKEKETLLNFFLKNIYFGFNGQAKQQISGTTFTTKHGTITIIRTGITYNEILL